MSNIEQLATSVKEHAVNAATEDLLADLYDCPKNIEESFKAASGWFLSLAANDKEHVSTIIKEVARMTGFGFAAILDGVRSTNSGFDTFILEGIDASGNKQSILPCKGNDLHDFFAPSGGGGTAQRHR